MLYVGQSRVGAQGPQGVEGAQGNQGLRGSSVLNGTGAPVSGVGVTGDYYLNNSDLTLWGPKISATQWPSAGIALKGVQGSPGAAGSAGPQGAAGAAGATGPAGSTGPSGPMGPTGSQGNQGRQGAQGASGAAPYDKISFSYTGAQFGTGYGSGGNPYLTTLGSGGLYIYNTNASALASMWANTGSFTGPCYASSYPGTSDYRLKQEVQPLLESSALVKQFKPYQFKFKTAPDEVAFGFLAHELQEFYPYAVFGTKDDVETATEIDPDTGVRRTIVKPVYQKVDYSRLVPLLTGAIQDLMAEVEQLKADVELLKNA